MITSYYANAMLTSTLTPVLQTAGPFVAALLGRGLVHLVHDSEPADPDARRPQPGCVQPAAGHAGPVS